MREIEVVDDVGGVPPRGRYGPRLVQLLKATPGTWLKERHTGGSAGKDSTRDRWRSTARMAGIKIATRSDAEFIYVQVMGTCRV